MIELKAWLNSEEYKRIDALSMGELVTTAFFRDPLRSAYLDPHCFYAMADGVVLYAYENLKPTDPIVTIKGKKFTVRQALDDPKYDHNSIVIGIFMTAKDVHVNRAPTSGYIKEEWRTPFIFTPNISMISEEEDLLEEAEIDKADMSYLFCNERRIIGIYNPQIKTRYYVIQIAERDVDVIVSWFHQGHISQCQRFGQIRFGSQVDIIVPLIKGNKYKVLAKRGFHVEAGVDRIIEIVT